MTRTRKAIRTVAKMIGGFRQTVTNAALALDNGVKAANSLATAAKKNATVTNMKAANAALNATTPLVNNASKAANSVLKRNVVPPVKVVANNGAAQVKAVNTAANHVLNATKSNYNFLSGGRRMTRRRR
jgi:Sec-independent protein translocase protein TatA